MKLSIDTPAALTEQQRRAINELAAHGFGFDNPEEMLPDTLEHINASNFVQQAEHEGNLAGFAFYRSALWRACS
jgi:hypothetical protein